MQYARISSNPTPEPVMIIPSILYSSSTRDTMPYIQNLRYCLCQSGVDLRSSSAPTWDTDPSIPLGDIIISSANNYDFCFGSVLLDLVSYLRFSISLRRQENEWDPAEHGGSSPHSNWKSFGTKNLLLSSPRNLFQYLEKSSANGSREQSFTLITIKLPSHWLGVPSLQGSGKYRALPNYCMCLSWN